ncbi:unnamed protein product [Hermetia illucens]|uniref:Macro domain-containing protein n=2 Tax=Hermetia illucens TaxID=343691 RepID=A0A7R8UM54_HERIL|nr:unnamed protein product [Hermetia illucens]
MCRISEISGDLFSASREYSLAHCVSADLRMGKGIALKFRDKFSQISKLKQQNPKPGGVVMLKDGSRYIYYLITKQKVYQKPTYITLVASLTAMRNHMAKNGIKKLAIPRIGCGLDGLIWSKVKTEVEQVFQDDDIEIVVYNFVPKK